MVFWHGIPWGVDFRGGTLVYVKYSHTPDETAMRSELDHAGLRNFKLQRLGALSNNEELIDLDVRETSEQALDQGKAKILQALQKNAAAHCELSRKRSGRSVEFPRPTEKRSRR